MVFQSYYDVLVGGEFLYYSDTIPSSVGAGLTGRLGDLCLNTNTASGQPLAWRCTTAGSPGVWEVVAAASGVGGSIGTLATPVLDPTLNGSALGVYANPTETAAGDRYNALRVESYAAPASSSSVGVYAIRGVAGVATGKTTVGTSTSFFAGVQGKLDFAGTMGTGASGSIIASAVLAQVGTNGTYGSEVQLYGLWVDNQHNGAIGAGLFDMVRISNNGSSLATNCFSIYAGAGGMTYLLNLESTAAFYVNAGAGGTPAGYLIINTPDGAKRINLTTA